MKDDQEIRTHLQQLLRDHPELQEMPPHPQQMSGLNRLTSEPPRETAFILSGEDGYRCFACDEWITAEQPGSATPYPCPSPPAGVVHRFHERCHTILLDVRGR